MNRIIIDDLVLNDQSGKELLKIGRLSAKFEILPLFSGKISIGNVQLFSFNANLERPTPQASTNFQFVLDAFASKDTVKKKSNLDLRINSLLIRRGKVSYDVLSAESTPGKFNPQHIRLSNILANISLKALQNDSVNAAIKRMSVEEEHSGFELKKLSLKIIANNRKMRIENFAIDLPNTSLAMDTIRMEYDSLESLGHFTDDVRFFVPYAAFGSSITGYIGIRACLQALQGKVEVGNGSRRNGQPAQLPETAYLFQRSLPAERQCIPAGSVSSARCIHIRQSVQFICRPGRHCILCTQPE